MKKQKETKSCFTYCEFVGHNKLHDHLKCLRENTDISPGDLSALAAGHVIASSLLKRK